MGEALEPTLADKAAVLERLSEHPAVKAIVDEVPVEGRLLFSNVGKFTKGKPRWVLMLDSIEVEFPVVDSTMKNMQGHAERQEVWNRLRQQLRPSPHSFTNL